MFQKMIDFASDSFPDEDLSLIPLYMRGRSIVEGELEDKLITNKPFIVSNCYRGQTRGRSGLFLKSKAVVDNLQVSGLFKTLIKLKDVNETDQQFLEKHKNYLNPTKLIVRVYILKGKALTPKDDINSDPYLMIKLGDTEVGGKETIIENTNFPSFYRSYDLPTMLPGPSTLRI